MHHHQLVPIKDSIATQLLKVVFAFYLILVVTVTSIHMVAEYVHTKTRVLQELKSIEATFKPGLDQTLWEMNLTQMRSIMIGIAQLPTIVGVQVEDDNGNIIGQIGQVLNQQEEAIVVDQEGAQMVEGTASRLFWHEFPLLYTRDDQEFPVGNVTMYSSSGVVFERVRFGFLFLMINAVIQIIAFWMLFLWISRFMLSRPLATLTAATEQISLDKLDNLWVNVETKGRNELKVLEEAFNAMIQKLLNARTQLYDYANELNQSRKQLQDILDNSTAVIYLKDLNGQYVLINRQYERLFHITKSDILGKTDYVIFPEDMANAFRANDRKVIETGSPQELEEYAPHDDGVHTYISIKFPLHDSSGNTYAVCGISTDITERKKTEEKIRKLNQELEQRVQERTARLTEAQRIAHLGNWDWNIRTDELFWSDEIYRIFGLQPQEFGATYEAFLDTIHHEDRDTVVQAVNAALYEGKPYSLDHRIVLPDGAIRIVHERGEVTFGEQHKPIWMVGTVQDITDQKRVEEELQKAKESAEAANRAKSVFLANMSHELRTPLNGILGYAQMLGRDSTLTDTQREGVEVIHRNGDHLLTLFNDILDFTKIEANKLELHPDQFALPSVLRQLAEMARFNAEHKGLSFVYEAPAGLPHIVYGDQKRLRQILLNLLGNAIRFTEQGRVTFRISLIDNCQLPIANCQLRFEVEDTGIGIASEHLESIFQPFQQADPHQLQEGSTGLGLAISQRLVNMMSSQFHITSTEGQGSTFWFELELPVIDATVTRVPQSVQKDSSGHSSQETLRKALASLPSDWLAKLRQGAEDVDLEVLSDIINHIRERDPALAEALTRLVEDFEYDAILAVLQ